ncbi:MAG: hypothetical protein ACFE78_05055 [Candidatus Hodarchaeota archaeon]
MINNFIKSLISNTAHKKHHKKLEIYENFIGSWKFDWVGHKDDGSTWTVPGEWHFSWILEGRAIQDNWICPRSNERTSGKYPEGEYGTTIRFYDFKDDFIKVVWIGPIISQLNIFKANFENNEIVQNEIMVTEKEKVSKWIFKEIKEDSFKWEAYISNDYGKTWYLNQEVFAERI